MILGGKLHDCDTLIHILQLCGAGSVHIDQLFIFLSRNKVENLARCTCEKSQVGALHWIFAQRTSPAAQCFTSHLYWYLYFYLYLCLYL